MLHARLGQLEHDVATHRAATPLAGAHEVEALGGVVADLGGMGGAVHAAHLRGRAG
ncbi:MAG: hypothetical protein ACE5GB_02310 [Acidimicrobiales bacterium]